MTIIEKTKSCLGEMTKSEQKVAAYCLIHLNDFAFETLDNIADKIGISTSSVIRFCRRLGFSGYKSLQNEIRSGFRCEQNLPDKLKRTTQIKSGDELLVKTMQNSISCIEQTFRDIPYDSVLGAVNLINNAQRVFCFGMKESFALAHYAYTRLLTVRDNVYMLSAGYNGEIESVLSLTKNDVCIVYLFHRYTKQAAKILKLLRDLEIPVILITASPYDEVEACASVILPVYVDANGIKNSAVAPVCLTDYLCNASAVSNGDKALGYMKKSEELFKKFVF